MTTAEQAGPDGSGAAAGPREVVFRRVQSGGRRGPNDEVLREAPGGQVWSDQWVIGAKDAEFQTIVPDIRMPANQYWPQHWHDEAIAVIVLDGEVRLGDRWMKRGDVVISPENVEYGPLVMGPSGCQLLEVFSRARAGGGYGEEFTDHPTLATRESIIFAMAPDMFEASCGDYVRTGSPFSPRPPGSEQNVGKAVLPNDTVKGLESGELSGGGAVWNVGEVDDPLRGVMLDTGYAAGQVVPPHRHRDARWVLVMEGTMKVGDREVTRDDILLIEAGVEVPAFVPGPDGVQLLEYVRTAAGVPMVVDEGLATAPEYESTLKTLRHIEFEPGRPSSRS
ncbi:cupin domain-containing protein [Streptomyces sp. NPDC090075]|uniref:cupin domain-containing protein n=1 Tax=Streptomyces sp. NPDC090075 TaxID=3365937 RepID=UPI0038031565